MSATAARLPAVLSSWSPYAVIAAICVVALVYTTPWDNYLVATRVWWYHPELVTGFVIGWVPIEEYTFFILQPILTGLWLVFLARRLSPPPAQITTSHAGLQRWGALAVLTALWFVSLAILFTGKQPSDLPRPAAGLGATALDAPGRLWRRYPLALSQAALLDDRPCHHLPVHCRCPRHRIGHVDDQPRAVGQLSLSAAFPSKRSSSSSSPTS